MSAPQFQYFAFISYKREDEKWAKKLQNRLETYRLPAIIRKERIDIPKTLKPIFRDKTDLSGVLLERKLNDELERSKFLIVICSPNAVKSKWVNKEIDHFIALGRTDSIIPVIVKGDPDAPDLIERSLPESLLKLRDEGNELLAIHMTRTGERKAFIQLVATILDIDFDKLWIRDRIRRRRRILARIFGIGLPLLVFIAYMSASVLFSSAYSYIKGARQQMELGNNVGAQLLLKEVENAFWLFDKSMIPAYKKRVVYRSPDLPYAIAKHDGAIRVACFTPEGDYFATAGENNTVRIWKTENGERVKELHFDSPVRALSFGYGTPLLVCYHDNRMVTLTDYQEEKRVRQFTVIPPSREYDNNLLDIFIDSTATKGYVGFIRSEFDAKGKSQIGLKCIPFTIHDTVSSYTWESGNDISNGFSDGCFAVCSGTGRFQYTDLHNRPLINAQLPIAGNETPAVILRTKNYILIFTDQRKAYPIALSDGKILTAFDVSTFYTLITSPCIDECVIGDSLGNIICYELPSGKIKYNVPVGTNMGQINYSQNGDRLYIALLSNAPFITVCDAQNMFLLDDIFLNYPAKYVNYALSADNKHLLGYYKDGTVHVYQNQSNSLVDRYLLPEGWRNKRLLELSVEKQIAFFTDDALSRDAPHTITVLDVKTGEKKESFITASEPKNACYDPEQNVVYIIDQQVISIHPLSGNNRYRPGSYRLPANLIWSSFTHDKKNVMLISESEENETNSLITIFGLDSLDEKRNFTLFHKVECGVVDNHLAKAYFVTQKGRYIETLDLKTMEFTDDPNYAMIGGNESFITLFDVDAEDGKIPVYLNAVGPYNNASGCIRQNDLLNAESETTYWSGSYLFKYTRFDQAAQQIIAEKTNGEIFIWRVLPDDEVRHLFDSQTHGRRLTDEDRDNYKVGFLNFSAQMYN